MTKNPLNTSLNQPYDSSIIKALRDPKANISVFIRRASDAIKYGLHDVARPYLIQAYIQNPRDRELLGVVGQYFLGVGDLKKRAVIETIQSGEADNSTDHMYDTSVVKGLKNPDSGVLHHLIKKVQVAMKRGHFRDARGFLIQAYIQRPQDRLLLGTIAQYFCKKGAYNMAAATIEIRIQGELPWKDAFSHGIKAKALYGLKRYGEALAAIQVNIKYGLYGDTYGEYMKEKILARMDNKLAPARDGDLMPVVIARIRSQDGSRGAATG